MSARSALVLGLGAGMVAQALVTGLTCWWYERFYLPRIAGED